MRFLFILFVSLSLVACDIYWPQQGTGGAAEVMSEHQMAKLEVNDKDAYREMIKKQTNAAAQSFYKLTHRGAKTCFPGLWMESHMQLHRTMRELSGRLYRDAYVSLLNLNEKLVTLNQRLSKIRNKKKCR